MLCHHHPHLHHPAGVWRRLSTEGRRRRRSRSCHPPPAPAPAPASACAPGFRAASSSPWPKQPLALAREQRLVVEAPDPCVRVVAGPGSGKTHVLIQRIVHLIQRRGISPSSILCITFTNKAAIELRERLGWFLETTISKQLTVDTFHSFCVRLLRQKPNSGIDRNFVIYDEDDCERLLRSLIQMVFMVMQNGIDKTSITQISSLQNFSKHFKDHGSTILEAQSPSDKSLNFHLPFQKMHEMGFFEKESKVTSLLLKCIKVSEGEFNIKEKKKDFKVQSDEVKLLLSCISKVKTHFMKEFIANQRCVVVPEVPSSVGPMHIRLAEIYQLALRGNNAIDFDDMIHLAVRVLHEDHAFKLVCQEKWKSILVDEFQDTDTVQYELIQLLAKEHRNLFVVGDIDQAIYGWRGAEPRHMQLSLEYDFPELATYKLERNYRSSENILRAASAILHHCKYNREMGSTALKLLPTKGSGEPIIIAIFQTCDEEAKFVASEMQRLVRGCLASWQSFAVMYRTHCQSFPLEAALARAQVPYMTIGKIPFYSHKEIKIMAHYLQLIASLDNEVALEYCINIPPRGIGDKSITKLKCWATSNNLSLFQALMKIYEESITHSELGITSKARDAIMQYLQLLKDLSSFSLQASVLDIVQELIKRLKLRDYVEKLGDPTKIRSQRLEQFMLTAKSYSHEIGKQALINFLEGLILASINEGKEPIYENTVKLITMHASKGMEFECVFLIGALEGIIPLYGANDEEERRLFYVGITRAKERLYLTCHHNPYQFSIKKPTLSRFIVEIQESLPGRILNLNSLMEDNC